MIKITGKIGLRKSNFYILQAQNSECIIIESDDGPELGDTISWNDYDEFYNLTQDCEISAIDQTTLHGMMSLQNAKNLLSNWNV